MQADNFTGCSPFGEKPIRQHKPIAMKKHLLLLVLLAISAHVSAQVMGNYGVQKQQEVQQQQNYPRNNYFQNQPQFRSVARPASILDNNQLEISINALSNQKAESYVAIFAMLQVGKTADETNTLLNARLDGFLAELKNLGIPAEDPTVQPDLLAGMVSGWVGHPSVHTAQFRYGRGRVVMTTFALEEGLATEPLASLIAELRQQPVTAKAA